MIPNLSYFNNEFNKCVVQDLRLYKTVVERSIITAFRGSIAHNLYVSPEQENGTDDIDIINITVHPRDYYFPVNRSVLPDAAQEWKTGQFDIVSYELSKFVYLLTKCNPNILAALWLNPEHYVILSHWGRELIKIRDLFLSRTQVYNSFSGYAYQQFLRMERGGTDAQYMGAKRRDLVAKYGFDTRNASHLVRLYKMGIELLESGTLTVFRGNDRQFLLDIKNGVYTLEDVKSFASQLEEQATEAYRNSSLQEEPELNKIQQFTSDTIHTILSLREIAIQ